MPLAVQTLSVVARRRVEAARGGTVTRGFSDSPLMATLWARQGVTPGGPWKGYKSAGSQGAQEPMYAYAQLLAGYAHIELTERGTAEATDQALSPPGEAAALSCQSAARLLRAMAGNSPQLQLAEDLLGFGPGSRLPEKDDQRF
eukprot:Skav234672  [mRNA]  locus=scaffold1131:460442:464285:- [translate_table: standard]